jgi:pyridinium-3,5-biscarboxylic acid mononucleotide sulfurtransferase
VSSSKLEQLRELFRSYGSCLVAYSGGVDSVFLARVARDVLGNRALAVIADSPSLPRAEFAEALELAKRFGIQLRVVGTREFENPDYLENPGNRCYYCKQALFDELSPIAEKEGFAVIVYGENATDLGDHRPGAQAAEEYRVRAPLKEVGLTKEEIREFSQQLGLPTAGKPQMACLSSRIPYGERVTPEKLEMIEEAEALLRGLGFRDVRVRHHELRVALAAPDAGAGGTQPPTTPRLEPGTAVHLARIEVAMPEMPRLLGNGAAGKIGEALRKIGYTHVTLDLLGYRRGSLNEQILFAPRPKVSAPKPG